MHCEYVELYPIVVDVDEACDELSLGDVSCLTNLVEKVDFLD